MEQNNIGVIESAVALTLALLIKFEGCHKVQADGVHAYLCPAGIPTQGYGVVVKDLNVPVISQQEAIDKLKQLIPLYMNKALRQSPHLITNPKRLAAITSFIYNLGEGAYAASTLKKRVNAENWEAAYTEMQKWRYTGKRELPGLVLRRATEGALLRG